MTTRRRFLASGLRGAGLLAALAAFLVVHVVQVLLHPRTLADMTLGGRRPEAPP